MEKYILNAAIDKFGKDSQISKAIEEMGELITDLARLQNSHAMNVNIISEIADVIIMMEQLKIIFGEDLVETHVEHKLKRLSGMLEHSS